ncbi:peptide chain release factor N(5)-glutamine methyltransferase [Candidatus Paracaedibacter symbiosus]|uniref:peptide chain release factor N(5)-glutamine methyltransferase n=1 Tax=Candidatus Paracaedibacter symbiosus TaxID=244582 RepID=UPI00068EB272|nr:peptide chain release factor N(5)-glutamine methyltransferase [Candidatus Paracaedibacter symbiosus]
MTQTIDMILDPLCTRLRQAGILEAPREARLIIAHVLGKTYESVYFNTEQSLTNDQLFDIASLIERRCQQEPLAKIFGHKEFWGLPFIVTKDTLDPRPDSETLIEALLTHFPDKNRALNILDLGTGSGCLILAALSEYKDATGVAVDMSFKALLVAKANALNLHLADRCYFICGDWATALTYHFDVILCNPPYISRDEILSAQTLHDPDSALFADKGGLAEYERLAIAVPKVMAPTSLLFLEVGHTQRPLVQPFFEHHGLQLMGTRWDLQGHERCLILGQPQG